MQRYHAVVSSKGQVVIPAELRRRLRIKGRTPIVFEEKQGTVQLLPVDMDAILALRGSCKGMGLWEELRKMKREEREREDKNF